MRAVTESRLASVCLLMLLCAAPLTGQTTRVDGGAISQGQAFGFYWETHLQPAMPALEDTFHTTSRLLDGVVHRVMLDRERRIYFGYRAAVVPSPGGDGYQVTIMPLVLTPAVARSLLGDDYASWTALETPSVEGVHWDSLPRATASGGASNETVIEIRSGQVLALRLLMNPSTGQQVVDYVSVQEPARPFAGFEIVAPREFSFAAGAPRDFRADDGELRITDPRLSIDGRLHESTAGLRLAESGAIVWIYVPERGRFLLSLTPHAELGFRRAGEVRGSALTFTAGGETFTLVSGTRIAGGAPFNLYVRHEPDWVPTYLHADRSAFTMGAEAVTGPAN